jgi:hypothetical protein
MQLQTRSSLNRGFCRTKSLTQFEHFCLPNIDLSYGITLLSGAVCDVKAGKDIGL